MQVSESVSKIVVTPAVSGYSTGSSQKHFGGSVLAGEMAQFPAAADTCPTFDEFLDPQGVVRLQREGLAGIVGRAQRAFDQLQPDVVVAKSAGGALAMRLRLDRADQSDTRLILIAPLWRLSIRQRLFVLGWYRIAFTAQFRRDLHSVRRAPADTVLLHCPKDKLVSVRDSRRLARVSGLSRENMIEVPYDGVCRWGKEYLDSHRMNFPGALRALTQQIEAM